MSLGTESMYIFVLSYCFYSFLGLDVWITVLFWSQILCLFLFVRSITWEPLFGVVAIIFHCACDQILLVFLIFFSLFSLVVFSHIFCLHDASTYLFTSYSYVSRSAINCICFGTTSRSTNRRCNRLHGVSKWHWV